MTGHARLRRVIAEELVLLISSSMCRFFDKLIELTRVAGIVNEIKRKYMLE